MDRGKAVYPKTCEGAVLFKKSKQGMEEKDATASFYIEIIEILHVMPA